MTFGLKSTESLFSHPLTLKVNLHYCQQQSRISRYHFVRVFSGTVISPTRNVLCVKILRRQILVMSDKQDHSSVGDFHSCSSKLVCPVSFVCLLICTAALVRVEILNQRVHHVEDVMAELSQIQELIRSSADAVSFQDSEKMASVGGLGNEIAKENRDVTKGIAFILFVL